MELYWVTTEDHDEDWFIIASSLEEASKLHEDMEGYNPGDAEAEEIQEIPKDVTAEPGWPTNELLLSIGVKFLRKDEPRVVEINGRKFSEGMLQDFITEVTDDAFEELGLGRRNKTTKSTQH